MKNILQTYFLILLATNASFLLSNSKPVQNDVTSYHQQILLLQEHTIAQQNQIIQNLTKQKNEAFALTQDQSIHNFSYTYAIITSLAALSGFISGIFIICYFASSKR